jgi:uncharacterized coiled-coil protein SlyX
VLVGIATCAIGVFYLIGDDTIQSLRDLYAQKGGQIDTKDIVASLLTALGLGLTGFKLYLDHRATAAKANQLALDARLIAEDKLDDKSSARAANNASTIEDLSEALVKLSAQIKSNAEQIESEHCARIAAEKRIKDLEDAQGVQTNLLVAIAKAIRSIVPASEQKILDMAGVTIDQDFVVRPRSHHKKPSEEPCE